MNRPSKGFELLGENEILFYIAFFKFLLLIFFAGNYGLFRDEFYYLDCSKHLSFGYVDQPPFSILVLAISRILFGESIIGIRIFAYIAGSATVIVAGLIARELGGKKYAQALTALCTVFSGVILGDGSYFSMNAFDILFSAITFYLLVKLIRKDNKKLWLPVGVMFGIGLENKLSFLFLGFGLAVGLILTRQRKYFLEKELYIAAVIAALIFLPNIIWQAVNHFPTIEFMRNAAERKNMPMSPLHFFLGSLMELNPAYIVLLFAALYFLFIYKEGRRFALVGWMYVVIFFVFAFNNGKPYYMGILFPAIIAAGAAGSEILIEKYLRGWVRYSLVFFFIPSFIIVTPFAVPVLSVDSFIHFSEFMGIKPESGERSATGILPQFYADRFGWKEMVEQVAHVYNSLPGDEKKKVAIIAQNYGEAGAVNYYGKQFGLPEAYSPQNSCWYWGPPNPDSSGDGEIVIVIGSNKKDNSVWFEQVDLAAKHFSKYGMPYENVGIFVCRKAKMPVNEIWKRVRFFI